MGLVVLKPLPAQSLDEVLMLAFWVLITACAPIQHEPCLQLLPQCQV